MAAGVSRDLRRDATGATPSSFLDELYPGEASTELDLTPRSSRPRHSTTTSDAFGALDVGLPVNRLPEPVAPAVQELPVQVPVAARPERCPSCGARVRVEQDWCSLCHASVLPQAEPAPEPALEPAPVVAPESVLTPAVAVPAVRVREDEDGQLALDFDDPVEPTPRPGVDETEVSRMLGVLARTSGGAPRGLGTRQARIAVAVGGGLGLTALLLGGMTALGSVLG